LERTVPKTSAVLCDKCEDRHDVVSDTARLRRASTHRLTLLTGLVRGAFIRVGARRNTFALWRQIYDPLLQGRCLVFARWPHTLRRKEKDRGEAPTGGCPIHRDPQSSTRKPEQTKTRPQPLNLYGAPNALGLRPPRRTEVLEQNSVLAKSLDTDYL